MGSVLSNSCNNTELAWVDGCVQNKLSWGLEFPEMKSEKYLGWPLSQHSWPLRNKRWHIPKHTKLLQQQLKKKKVGKCMGVLLQRWQNKLVDLTAFCLGNKQRDYLRIIYAGAAVECTVSRKQMYLSIIIRLPTLPTLYFLHFLHCGTHFYTAVRVMT